MSAAALRIVVRGEGASSGDALLPLRRFSAEAGMPARVQHDLLLIADEVVSNWLKYGRAGTRAGELEVEVRVEPGRLLLRFEDSGPAFNPLAAPPPDLESPLGQRQLGGLGVHLVRALTASQRYARVGDRNVLELSLPLAG